MIAEYKPAILFLVKYVLLYVGLNTAYAYYVKHYLPNADPVTIVVTQHTGGLLSVFHSDVDVEIVPESQNVPITRKGNTILMVFEGCNSISVMIVYVAFLLAFSGPGKLFIRYLLLGLLSIYLINMLRLSGLYFISTAFPDGFYFFHKFFFTSVIYLVVFAIWYLWVADIKRWRLQVTVSNE